MADEPNPQSTPSTPPPANSPEARGPTGELKTNPTPLDQPSTTPPEKSTTESTLAAKTEDKKPETAPQVPDKYEFKAPEGFEVDPAVIEEATPILKELGITQEGASKLFDLFSKHSAAGETKLIDAYQEVRDGWRKDIIADKALGNGKDGLSAATLQNVSAAIDALPPDIGKGFREAMDLTGAGDNPAFVRAMNALGAMLREGTAVRGTNPSPAGQKAPGAAPQSPARALYPNLPSSAG